MNRLSPTASSLIHYIWQGRTELYPERLQPSHESHTKFGILGKQMIILKLCKGFKSQLCLLSPIVLVCGDFCSVLLYRVSGEIVLKFFFLLLFYFCDGHGKPRSRDRGNR